MTGGLLADFAGYQAVFGVAGVFALLVFGIALSYRDRQNRVAARDGEGCLVAPSVRRRRAR